MITRYLLKGNSSSWLFGFLSRSEKWMTWLELVPSGTSSSISEVERTSMITSQFLNEETRAQKKADDFPSHSLADKNRAFFIRWLSHSVVSDSFETPLTIAHQAPLSMGFSKPEYWSGLPFPSPGDLANPGIEPGSPALEADFLPSESLGKPLTLTIVLVKVENKNWKELSLNIISQSPYFNSNMNQVINHPF